MADNQTTQDFGFRGELAKKLTTYALICVGLIAALTLLGAGVDAIRNSSQEKTDRFFEIAKYLLATILPVVSGWVGTVLAFYFGKENFEAGTKSVTTAARALTSKEKLATTTVATLGKARSELTGLVVSDETKAKATDLQAIKDAFQDKTVPTKLYERLPIFLTGDLPFMVLHRSTLNGFLVEAAAGGKTPKEFTLQQLIEGVKYSPQQSFVSVRPDATADSAKTEMEKVANCSDVFVTADGTRQTAVTRWITNVDLLKAAEV
jgi:hypothetical protein